MAFPLKPPGQCCSNFVRSLHGQENERLLKWVWSIEKMLIISNGFSSEASGPVLLKFHAEPMLAGE